jgi:Ca2+-transporting ATPase
VLVLSAIVVPVLLLQETDFVQAGLTAVSLAVAAIPEGLPAVVTLTLALGVRKMSEENALVRRLPAVEALGSVDVICTDKTGTLTRGEMTVEQYWTHDSVAEVDADADATDLNDRETRLLEIAAVCNDATSEEGDPTEQALVEAAVVHGFDVDGLRSDRPRTDEVPFSSERKWMGTIHDDVGYVKGAPEVVLANADQLLTEEGPRELTDADRTRIEGLVEAFADDALRVLAMAYHESPASGEDLGDGLVFVGLMGMIDPPREEVADAIATTRRAGIDVKMVTGDNGQTARAIAESIGLGTEVRTGPEIEAMTDEELREHVEAIDVFARTSPEHKVRILEALQDCGHRVAMTGDGVNDAPALKNADVGVAMGIRGTDVAKQASDIVLLDDNYTTIERAVERGRGIFDNVWKFVAYLLSANVAEVAIVFIASLYGYLILPAVQLLWINLLTDGLPALALGADPGSKDVMERSPRSPDQGIVGRPMLEFIGGAGVVTTIVVLGLMFLTLDGRPESIESVLSLDAFGGAVSATDYAVTMVFTAFVVLEFGKLAVIRWLRGTRFFTNPWLGVAILASFLLQLAVLYTPLSRYFDTVGLWLLDWGLIAGVGAICLPAYLLVATVVRRRIE